MKVRFDKNLNKKDILGGDFYVLRKNKFTKRFKKIIYR